MEQYKRAFARQRARDLAQHADTLLSKDKELAALQQECWELEARLGSAKVGWHPPYCNTVCLLNTHTYLIDDWTSSLG